jgi:hypothetical protein
MKSLILTIKKMIDNDITKLEINFQRKMNDFLKEVRIKYPNVEIFE